MGASGLLYWISVGLLLGECLGADPFANFELDISYITASPLGVPQQVIAVNGKFPGPVINVTTNYNVVVNVRNKLDENLLMTWSGIQMRRSSWQDGVLGTNCPIPPKWNWTYQFQVKDQIGSFFYYPSLNMQRASGGFGPFIALRTALDGGRGLGMPDGVLINGKGPYRYNTTLVPDGIEHETINVDPGKTYRIRVHNVGVSTCLNFRIQSHNLLLAETEGYYTSQQNYTSLDVHVGQSYSFLVTMDQNASSDYYIVASARFVNESLWQRVTGVAVLHYSNSKGNAAGPLPDPPNDVYDPSYSLNQAMSIRQNVSASGARPNPQGSFHYGSINVTDTYMLKSLPPVMIGHPSWTDLSSMLRTKGFIEIILQNNDTVVQTFHLDGYSFFVVGMGYGEWTENNRGSYNRWDAISRSTVQVFAGGWTAVYVSLDNVGVWNLRTENLDRWYLGQETYMRIINPEDTANKTELPPPDNVLYCGALSRMQKPQKTSSALTLQVHSQIYVLLLLVDSKDKAQLAKGSHINE
ncbi:hypothetical protein DH2020_022486 [Rehmannia glutinosa]|uniref:Monocopper oxidase-like protein n=1 Tax=Rehmannia glutinosa TaxID=99300 RepID=A0ABR0WGE3_REHGL